MNEKFLDFLHAEGEDELAEHIKDNLNPHKVTVQQIGRVWDEGTTEVQHSNPHQVTVQQVGESLNRSQRRKAAKFARSVKGRSVLAKQRSK